MYHNIVWSFSSKYCTRRIDICSAAVGDVIIFKRAFNNYALDFDSTTFLIGITASRCTTNF